MSNRTQIEYETLNIALRAACRHNTGHGEGIFARIEPDQALAFAVLCRAILDLDSTINKGTAGAQITGIDRAHAYIFCFSESPAWKKSREDWCDQAMINPAGFSRLAKRYMHLARSRFGFLTDDDFMSCQDKIDETNKAVARENAKKKRKRKEQFAF